MFDSSRKSLYLGGHKDKFKRLDHLDSQSSSTSDANKCSFGIQGLTRGGEQTTSISMRLIKGIRKCFFGFLSIPGSLWFTDSKTVSARDLLTSRKILDPQDKFLILCHKLIFISCIMAISVDPIFFYLPVFNSTENCLGIDQNLAIVVTTLRTIIDAFYLVHIALQFRTAYIAPSSTVFGRGELVTDRSRIARRYLHQYFLIDFLSVLPLPQIVVWRYLQRFNGSDVLPTKRALLIIILIQYIPRLIRIVPLTSEMKRTVGVLAESAWAGAAYYLVLYMLASHTVGALWYLLSVERQETCWHRACIKVVNCSTDFLYCSSTPIKGLEAWRSNSTSVLQSDCASEEGPFDFGIYTGALSSGVIASKNFVAKYYYCLWWGLQNLSTLGQGLETSTYPGEVVFSIALAVGGLILFALLIGNMQTYLQSITIRLEEMRIKKRDSEEWMHHRRLPLDLRERVRRYDQYKWLATRGVDEEKLVQSLPKDLSRDIKRHLCLALVRRVPLFEAMDERLLDAICERLKPCLFTVGTYVVREGDPVDEMLFIIRGHLDSVTTDGGRTGFLNNSHLEEGNFCGEELLTWALDPRSGLNLPSSTRTVKTLTEVEAFALASEDLKFVASQFKRLYSRQFQHIFRFYSEHWRTWAACFIQAAWRRYLKRKTLKLLRDEDGYAVPPGGALASSSGPAYSIRATFLASKFAANALRGLHQYRTAKIESERLKLQKPPEPDFTADNSS